ncbi:MAG: hypothetical protein GAK37_03202 [Pseudomonas sp.]|nr:MAG: hypothetical protein GAK37_03202 [Pseudomonas sp.]
MLVGKQVAGAPHAGLYFVEHQQRVVRIAQLAGTLQVGKLSRQYAAFTLDRLQHHGAGLVRHCRFQRSQVVIRNVSDAGDFRTKTVGVLRLATHVHGEQGATVKTVQRRDDLVLLAAKTVERHATGQFERGLVGFGAGVAEEHTFGKRGIDQLVRQSQRWLVGEHVGDVPQLVGLFGQCADQRRMGMAQYVDRDAAGKVNQLAPRLVPHARTLATHGNERGRCVVGNHDLVEIGTLHRGLLNGHRSLLKRNACLELAGDAGIVRTVLGAALSPSDNFL